MAAPYVHVRALTRIIPTYQLHLSIIVLHELQKGGMPLDAVLG